MGNVQFHPVVQEWFQTALGAPTPAQRQGWASIAAGRHTLISAPTGSGKTLAAFLTAIDRLFTDGLETSLADEVRVLYVSPLKALVHDVNRNLRSPLAGIGLAARKLAGDGAAREVTVGMRTGDTPAEERRAFGKRPPDILVTTPESLYLLLTSQAREALRERVRLGVEDEVDLALAVERHRLVAVPGDRLEPHAFEHRGHGGRVGRGVLDELEAVRAHGVLPGSEFHGH